MSTTHTITLTGPTPANRAFLDRAKAAAELCNPIWFHGFMFRVVRIDKDRKLIDNVIIELEEIL